MEWDNDIDLGRRKFSSRLIVERTLARGWRICGFKSSPAIFLIYIPGKAEPVKIFSASPPDMPYPAAKIAKDKFVTNQLLGSQGLPVPQELLYNTSDNEDSVLDFLKATKKVVVKPLDASHGKGITVGITKAEELKRAINEAVQVGSQTAANILLQQHVEGIDIRIVCFDYHFVDAISRTPASVMGDGKSSIEALINTTNTNGERGENYKTKLNVIPLQKAQQFLGAEKMQSIPVAGESVQVIGVSNVGMGGVRQNIKERIPDELKVIAEKAARVIGLPVCGVDFMVRQLPQQNSLLTELDPYIIEVNECPMLTMYEDLHSPGQHDLVDTYLDRLAKALIP